MQEIIELKSLKIWPLSSQLDKITGDIYHTGAFRNFEREGLSAESGNIIEHIRSGKLFRIPLVNEEHDFKFEKINDHYSMGVDKYDKHILYQTHWSYANSELHAIEEPYNIREWDEYPAADIIAKEIFLNDNDRWRHSLVFGSDPVEINEYTYDQMLNCLPPRNWSGSYFEVGEADHHNSKDKPVHRAFYKKDGRFYTSYPRNVEA